MGAIEFLSIESGRLLQHGGRLGWRSTLLLEVGETLAEGHIGGRLDKAKRLANLPAVVTAKEIELLDGLPVIRPLQS